MFDKMHVIVFSGSRGENTTEVSYSCERAIRHRQEKGGFVGSRAIFKK